MSRLYTQEKLECTETDDLFEILVRMRRTHYKWGYRTPLGVSILGPAADRDDMVSSILWHQEEIGIKIRRCLDKASEQSVL